MNDTATATDLEKLLDELQKAAETIAANCPEVSEHALGLIAGLRYGDKRLVDSALACLLPALAKVADECIEKELEASVAIQEGLRDGWEEGVDTKALDLSVLENVKDKTEWLIDGRIASMTKTRDLVHGLGAIDQPVERSQALEDGIRQLRTFRGEFLKRFPSRREPYPINREAVARAREAFRAGHKGLSKDQMVWRDRRSDKAV